MERSTSLVSHVYLVCKSDRHLISPNSITPESNIGYESDGNDHKLKKLLIVRQVLPVGTTGNV